MSIFFSVNFSYLQHSLQARAGGLFVLVEGVGDVANYIQHHMSEPITAEKIAEELFLSRPYLYREKPEYIGLFCCPNGVEVKSSRHTTRVVCREPFARN